MSISITDSNGTNSYISNSKKLGSINPTSINLGTLSINSDNTINIGNNDRSSTSYSPSKTDLKILGNTQIYGKIRCGSNVEMVDDDYNYTYLTKTSLLELFGDYTTFSTSSSYPYSLSNENKNKIAGNMYPSFSNPYIHNKYSLTGSNKEGMMFLITQDVSGNNLLTPQITTDPSQITATNFSSSYILTEKTPVSIATDGWIYSLYGFINPSDKRIKMDIETYDTSKALQQINSLSLKTFKKIDNPLKKEIGFIAQEVYEQIPESIEKIKNYIPNIYKWVECFYDSETHTISFDNSFLFSFMDQIQIIDENNKKYLCKVIDVEYKAVVHSTDFIDNPPLIKNRVFIYGKYIDDFMSLNKEIIFSISIGAIQALEKKISELTKRIELLEKL